MKMNHSQCMFSLVATALLAWPAVAQPVAAVDPQQAAANAPLPPLNPTLPPLNLPAAPAPAAAPSAPANGNALPALPTAPNPSAAANPAAPTSSSGNASGAAPSAVSAITNALGSATGANAGQAAPAAPKVYSYGDSSLSILFLPEQVEKMKEAVRSFEDSGATSQAPAPVVPEVAAAAVPEPPIEDPLTMPVFYLASIAYDGPGDWSVWISGYKITSRKNDTDVNVIDVSPESVTFQWTPGFTKALLRRHHDKLFAPTDKVKNKLAALQRYSVNETTGTVTFTLKQNQSFAVGYFRVFEGYIDAPTLAALPVAPPVAAATPVAASQPNGQPPGFDNGLVNGAIPPSPDFVNSPDPQMVPPN
jgi:hypothetical protein